KFGPRPTLTLTQVEHARQLINQGGRSVKDVAALLGVNRSTLYRGLAKEGT
ncbi:MAG: Hin recombinase, partial [Ferrovum sp.]|nr:Hin recombinase [Ferrovum sp.]